MINKKKISMIKNSIIGFVFVFGVLLAGTDGTIRGNVTDLEGSSLPGAQIYIADMGLGTMADVDGNYILLNIPVGDYDVTVSMIGFKTNVIEGVAVLRDETVWLNFSLSVAALEGDVVYVSAEKALVEKGSTSKKVTVSKEAIEALPIRDVTELYSLQSGVVKVESQTQGIPDHNVRGLEEVHVKGGRAGEIAYMIDGLYIRNPIFGGIGDVTNLNLFAIREFDWQPGGFNAEYGDAMSAISNLHTSTGSDEFSYKFKYETSMVGAALGNEYDLLRGNNEYNLGFGGKIPFTNKFYYWFSGRWSNNDAYRVYEFDDTVYLNDESDYFNEANLEHNLSNLVQPYDTEDGFRAFGFDKVWDAYGKLSYNPTNKLRFNTSFWTLSNHRKGFDTKYLFWDDGQNELFRETYRFTADMNHSLGSSTFYTIRYSYFQQDMFLGVRWQDNDNDGFPDWFEWRNGIDLESAYGTDQSTISDPYNKNIVPYTFAEDSLGNLIVDYTTRDMRSGWHEGATPGTYNWDVVDGEDPELIQEAIYRDGSYWLLPEMYIDYVDFTDYDDYYNTFAHDPYIAALGFPAYSGLSANEVGGFNGDLDPFYYLPTVAGEGWSDGQLFGGSDNFYTNASAVTNEIRFDLTSQVTDKWKVRTGLDLKSHKLEYFEMKYPWLGAEARINSFAEFWEDTGKDGLIQGSPEPYIDEDGSGDYDSGEDFTDSNGNGVWDEKVEVDFGEGNGQWENGEDFTDSNNNGEWDNFREPQELSFYLQNTFEVPWMVINAGIRFDGVNYNTQVWSDPYGEASPNRPWYFYDVGDPEDDSDDDLYADNGKYDEGVEIASDTPLPYSGQTVFFTEDPGKWYWKVSPRLGFSHVITDQATFTFNYGDYYQTPTYQNVYLNTNRQKDPEELFEESDEQVIGNSTMTASRTQSYEFGFNIQVSRNWAYSVAGWVKDIDQLVTVKRQRSGVYSYDVFSNGDFGSAKGIDLTLNNRGMLINTSVQYTYSVAKANSEHDWAAIGNEALEAPLQESLMSFDRTHDLTLSMYTFLPFGINVGITGFFQSGSPYTPLKLNGDSYEEDSENQNTKRSPSYKTVNLAISKYFSFKKSKVSLGLNISNVFNIRNEIDIYALTGTANDPGNYYTQDVGVPYGGSEFSANDPGSAHSGSYYDRPWMFSRPRELNFFVRLDFN